MWLQFIAQLLALAPPGAKAALVMLECDALWPSAVKSEEEPRSLQVSRRSAAVVVAAMAQLLLCKLSDQRGLLLSWRLPCPVAARLGRETTARQSERGSENLRGRRLHGGGAPADPPPPGLMPSLLASAR